MTKTKIKDNNDYFVPATSDGCFRSFFHKKNILIQFLTDLLNIPIVDLFYLDTTMQKEYDKNKESRLDVIVELKDKTKINVEMQNCRDLNMMNRSLFYVAKMINRSFEEGNNYATLANYIVINILNYKDPKYKNLKTCYMLTNEENPQDKIDKLKIYMIALKEEGKINKKLREWIEIFREKESWNMEKYDEHRLKEAVAELKRLSRDPEVMYEYDKEQKERIERESLISYMERTAKEKIEKALNDGEKRGIERGIEKGIERGKKETIMETTINLFKNGISKEIISKSLNIPLDELNSILKQNNLI